MIVLWFDSSNLMLSQIIIKVVGQLSEFSCLCVLFVMFAYEQDQDIGVESFKNIAFNQRGFKLALHGGNKFSW